MKTPLIALCLLLAVPPANAQQNTAPRTPNFYVPYGIRDVPLTPIEMESSSDATRIAEPGQQLVNAPPLRPHPMRRGRYRGVQQNHGPRFQPLDSTGGAVVGAVVAGVLLAVLAGCGH